MEIFARFIISRKFINVTIVSMSFLKKKYNSCHEEKLMPQTMHVYHEFYPLTILFLNQNL